MTYCLGFKTDSASFIVADAAVTGVDGARNQFSSFGEATSDTKTGLVAERALKTIVLPGPCAFTFAGTGSLGRSLANTLNAAMKNGMAPRSALQATERSHLPLASGLSCEGILVWHDSKPRMMAFNLGGGEDIQEIDQIVQLGSIGPQHKALSQAIVEVLAKAPLDNVKLLATMLGVCQSYGTRDLLLDRGVGGAFSGVAVNHIGVFYQPDIAYFFYTIDQLRGPGSLSPQFPVLLNAPKFKSVFVGVRERVLVARSTVNEDRVARAFVSTLDDEKETEVSGRTERALDAIDAAMDLIEPDFVTFINVAYPTVTIVDTRGSRTLRNIILRPTHLRRAGDTLIPVSLSPHLTSLLLEDRGPEYLLGFHVVPGDPIPHRHRNAVCACGSGRRYRDCHRP